MNTKNSLMDNGTVANGSSLVLVKYDRAASVSSTFDLGFDYKDFSLFNTSFTGTGGTALAANKSWDLTTGDYAEAFTKFRGLAKTDDIRWGVFAVDSVGLDNGATGIIQTFNTTNSPLPTKMTNSQVGTQLGNVNTFINGANFAGDKVVSNHGAAVSSATGNGNMLNLMVGDAINGVGGIATAAYNQSLNVVERLGGGNALSNSTFTLYGTDANRSSFSLTDKGVLTFTSFPTPTPPIQISITGTANNDLLVNLPGNNQINGGEGIDTLVVSGLPSQYKFSQGTSTGTLTGVGGVDTLTSIEFIRFGASLSNKQLASDLMPSQLVDPDGNGPRLSPVNELIKSFSVLYIAYFNRSPDIEGLMYWFKELNSGNQSLSQVSAGFTKSPEYSKAYPAGSSNREFITQIYNNLFDRAPDTGGLNFWENTLNAGSPRDVFINTVINGAYAPTGGAGDRALLDNKHAVSLHYTEKLSSFPTEAFDMGISTVLNRVTSNQATVNQGLAVIDYVMDNPITLTGLINDAQAFNAYWSV